MHWVLTVFAIAAITWVTVISTAVFYVVFRAAKEELHKAQGKDPLKWDVFESRDRQDFEDVYARQEEMHARYME